MMSRNRIRRIPKILSAVGVCVVCGIGLLILYSCTTTQQILLRGDGSGSVQFHVNIDKILMNAPNSLSQGGSSSVTASEFDIPSIKAVFAKNQSVKLSSLTSKSSGVLTGSFTFSDIGKLFRSASGSAAQGILSFSRSEAENVLKVHITRSNFSEIAHLAGMSNNPLYQMFGPEQNAATSISDLNQMMVYVLGDSGPDALKASSIDVEVKVDGKVLSQTGGVQKGNSVDFHIPLVRLLLLAKPLDYSIIFS